MDPRIARALRTILHAPSDPKKIRHLHEQDEQSKWFGVVRDPSGQPVLEDYGRYATLALHRLRSGDTGTQFPQLVSFIGATHAGKSSVVKMLIQLEALRTNDGTIHPSPVVGSVAHTNLPTSGDVHLYADPSTAGTPLPILYADCEGFEGGETTPMGSMSQHRRCRSSSTDTVTPRLAAHCHVIRWAGSEETRRREYIVTGLFPRLLYAVSDCVVFVLRNAKTFQSVVLTKLLEWGAAAIDKSLNTPALPHCIIVQNASDLGVHDREWEIEYATRKLLSAVDGPLDCVEGVPRFRELASHWRSLGRQIDTVEDLILCYYSSVRVIRVPGQRQYDIAQQQIGTLHALISQNCRQSFHTKQNARMLLNAGELNSYLRRVFHHFTDTLHIPFDFVQAALSRTPVPSSFGAHILQLCATLSARLPSRKKELVLEMFENLSFMLASCIILDCSRFRKGPSSELFASYERSFDDAIRGYRKFHSPCAYTSPDGSRSCALVQARHLSRGHQDERGIFAAGDHVPVLDDHFAEAWKEQLRSAVDDLRSWYEREMNSAAGAAVKARLAFLVHLRIVGRFYELIGPATELISHSTCLCCLMQSPTHPLPCAHVLCNSCMQASGEQYRHHIRLAWCPLHRDSSHWIRPTLVRIRPSGAGVNILSLDSGGIRGIVQLEVLRAIEQALGGRIPVQRLFDLTVGSGTGGLIAVALAKEAQKVDDCLDMFVQLCSHAYKPRRVPAPRSVPTFQDGALMSRIPKSVHFGPQCDTDALHAALKMAFTAERNLFGSSEQFASGAKVAVTSAGGGQCGVKLLTNYRRPDSADAPYSMQRAHGPTTEIKTFESVAATMAEPAYFEPLVSRNNTYVATGPEWANPIVLAHKEAMEIWSDAEPGITLSLGTGQHKAALNDKLRSEIAMLHAPVSTSLDNGGEESKRGKRKRARPRDDVLEAELAWYTFKVSTMQQFEENRCQIRLNLDLGEDVPTHDRSDRIEALQTLARHQLQAPRRRVAVRNLAYRLFATSFHLDVRNRSVDEDGSVNVRGSIGCRFEDGSMETKAIGRILSRSRSHEFEPYFQIRSDLNPEALCFDVAITTDNLARMVDNGIFKPMNVAIGVQAEQGTYSINLFVRPGDHPQQEGFPISGFPQHISRPSIGHALQSPRLVHSTRSAGPAIGDRMPSESSDTRHACSRSRINSGQSMSPTHAPSASIIPRPSSFGRRRSERILGESHHLEVDPALPMMESTRVVSEQTRAATNARRRSKSCSSSTNTLHPRLNTTISPASLHTSDARDGGGSCFWEVRPANTPSSAEADWISSVPLSQTPDNPYDAAVQPTRSLDGVVSNPCQMTFGEESDLLYDLVEKELWKMSSR